MESESDKKNNPLVSVVVPVYNGESYLKQSLDSIVAQTYQNIEILVMDDASTDTTPAIIESYGDRVAHHRNDTNLGQFGNVNKGIGMANGEFVCVYHADDIYKPEIVEREAQYLINNPSAGAVFCLDIFIDAEGNVYNQLEIPDMVSGGGPFNYQTILNALLTYKNVFLIGPTSMVRQSVYKDVGPYNGEVYGIAGDLEMWARIARKHDIGIIEEHLHYYRHNHGNLTQNYFRLRTEIAGHFRILEEHLESGGLKLATNESIKAHHAHLAEDKLMVAINYYIKGELNNARELLSTTGIAELIRSPQIQRVRLSVLYILLIILCRLPRIRYVANLFNKRWHGGEFSH